MRRDEEDEMMSRHGDARADDNETIMARQRERRVGRRRDKKDNEGKQTRRRKTDETRENRQRTSGQGTPGTNDDETAAAGWRDDGNYERGQTTG